MKLNKREVIDLLEREYIRGTSTLPILAESLGCTWQRLSQLGREHFPEWKEHSRKRMKEGPSKRRMKCHSAI